MTKKDITKVSGDIPKQPPKIGSVDMSSPAYKEAKKFSELKDLLDLVNGPETRYHCLLREMLEPHRYD